MAAVTKCFKIHWIYFLACFSQKISSQTMTSLKYSSTLNPSAHSTLLNNRFWISQLPLYKHCHLAMTAMQHKFSCVAMKNVALYDTTCEYFITKRESKQKFSIPPK
jgi:hypothetical protein